MRVKIFANNINHLTDARYFAAWGATWMCYNVSSLSLTEIAAIREWVEGPKHIINVIGVDPSEAAAMLTNEAVDGYLTDNLEMHQGIQRLTPRKVEAFIINHSAEGGTTVLQVDADANGSYQGQFCDIEGSPSQIISFIENHQPAAIILAGSEEEVVGVKSFDQLDEILEGLEEKDL